MNSFFNSFDYINLLEASMAQGNRSATMYKLMSKTRHLLGQNEGVLKNYYVLTNKTHTDRLTKMIVETLINTKYINFKRALEINGVTYHNYKHYFNASQKDLINQYRK